LTLRVSCSKPTISQDLLTQSSQASSKGNPTVKSFL
jgi:hypothetical protein